eukprot:3271863-Rhodomonas_salina.1
MLSHNSHARRPATSRADDIAHTDDEEEDGEEGEFDVFCNIRIEQTVLGRAPLVRNCKETTLGFSASGQSHKSVMPAAERLFADIASVILPQRV